jgi:deoxycytidine triphosphate deaminase
MSDYVTLFLPRLTVFINHTGKNTPYTPTVRSVFGVIFNEREGDCVIVPLEFYILHIYKPVSLPDKIF